MTVDFNEALTLLHSHLKLERDRGLDLLKRNLQHSEDEPQTHDQTENLRAKILGYIEPSTASTWETRQGGLLAAKLVVSSKMADENFVEIVRERAMALTHDDEARVRQAAGEVLGILCQEFGPSVYEKCCDELLRSVKANLERHIPGDNLSEGQKFTDEAVPVDVGKMNSIQVVHESAGWRHLETSMRCLQHVIEGCGPSFSKYITTELLKLLFQALDHTNRFVRETGYQVFASLVRLGVSKDAPSSSALSPEQELENRQSILNYGDQLADYLKKGLADNWSQVRLASSWATRSFLVTLGDNEAKERFYPKLLPPMCLNRYYVAAGVRIYSQENWKIITGNDGKRLVEKFIKETVQFYISQTKADNHAVREAACECIAELGIKICPDAVRPHVGKLLEAMIECFKDEGWPVRDAACLACGNFVQCFPEECRSSLDTLYELFFTNLCDNIPSVRQGAAASLANVVKTYGSEAVGFVTEKAKEKLKAVEKQENTDDRFAGLEKGAGLFGVIKRQRDNDVELHSNQTMYSCGSLAPKMGRGGCSNSHFKRPSQPWEITDGCIYLVAELSKLQTTQEQMKVLIPLMAEMAKHRHYSQYLQLYESICKQLPVVAKGVGKRHFKTYIEAFLDLIFHSLTSENALTSTAAVECIQELAKFLGPSILRGRVELYNSGYLTILDGHIHC